MIRSPRVSALTVAAIAALLQAHCGGDVARDPEPTPSSHPFVAEMTNATCQHSSPCCAGAGLSADDARCRSSVTRVWEQIVQSATAKGRVYNADAASKCLAEATAAFARCSFAPDLHTCARVFTGKAGPGESCTEAADCADRPNEFASCTTKTCAYTPALRLGERCGASSTPGRCEYPLRCMLLPDAVEAHCAERGSIGAPCREHLDCDDGLYCDTATGACAKGRAYGERCEMDPSRCLSTSCDAATDTCTTLAYCKR